MKHFTLFLSLCLLTLTSITAQTRAAVKAEDYPFVLTTDPEHPALYYIYTGRDGNGEASEMVFVNEIPWGESDYKLQLMYKNPNKAELTQLWYFMEEDGKIKIISAADNRMITVANTSDGAQKVYTQTAEDRTHAYYLWTLDKTGGYYAFKTSDGKTFLSHNGNWATGKSMMGLYNADGSKDEGSRVFFEACNEKAEDYPFVLTTDPEHPALYYIYTGRDGNGEASEMVFVNEIPWGESDYKLQIMYKNPNKPELTQLWYFMEEDGKIKIISAADNRMITVANTSDGAQKVYTQTAEDRTHAYYLWILDKTGGYYAFKTSDGKTFLSHNGNWAKGKSMMGLYNADGSKDEGSRVFFEACNEVSGIKSAMPEREFKYGIFTITGKRINKITRPGVYIINGKKRVVR